MCRRLLGTLGLLALVASGTIEPAVPAHAATSSSTHAGPLVFFRTVKRNTIRPLRRVLRVDPRTGRDLRSVTLPADFRSFVDAAQVGDTSFLVWTSKHGQLWLGAAGTTGRIMRRWRIGRAGGFDVTPVPEDPFEGSGTGFLRVSPDRHTALLVNGQGRDREGLYIDLPSGAVRKRLLPRGVRREVADVAAVGDRFVLLGFAGDLVTVGARGELVARGRVRLPAGGPRRIGFVDLVALPSNRAVVSFTTNRSYKFARRRFVARYNARSGALEATRTFLDPGGDTFAATATRFEVFADEPYKWIAGRIDGGPLREVEQPGPGPRPAPAVKIEADVQGTQRAFSTTTSTDGKAFVLRAIDYENYNDQEGYAPYEVLEVDVTAARVLRRTRFGDDSGGPSGLPFAFDIRVS